MAVTTAEFGYFPHELEETCGPISISTLTDLAVKATEVQTSGTVEDGWVYAPLGLKRDVFNDKTHQMPYPCRVFGMPKTHVLKHDSADGLAHLQFLVWCVGFFEGMRLTTSERGFLDATPVRRGTLTDFVLHRRLASAIQLAESFWQLHHGHHRRTKRIEGIIHVLFMSSYPLYLEFERFMYLYTALDGCYALTKDLYGGKSQNHASRIEWMCQKFDIPVPVWAQSASSATEVSAVRNDTFHEALFFQEPLGFAVYGGAKSVAGVPLQMHALVCRLIVALLGKPDCAYVKEPVDARQRYSLDLI